MDLRTEGRLLPNGQIQLTLELGPLFKHGAKVYSEPSHRLMLAACTPEFRASPEGARLLEELERDRAALVVADVTKTTPSVLVDARPPHDASIAYYAVTDAGEYLVGELAVGRVSFAFSVGHAAVDGVLVLNLCCQLAGCAQTCKECPDRTRFVTCCQDIQAGCCNSTQEMYCGAATCPMCPP